MFHNIIDDVQMKCVRGPFKGQCIFLSGYPNARGRLIFTAERVKWVGNEETGRGDNVTLQVEKFNAERFGKWLVERRKTGWRFYQ